MNTHYNPKLHRFAKLTAGITFLLLWAGALVTGTDSGLSVPDWPLSFGQFFPEMKGGVIFEHGHRMIAGCVAITTLILVIWIFLKDNRRWMRWTGVTAIGMVLTQALLGGLTVLLKLPPAVSIGHAAMAEAFFCMTVCLAVFTSSGWINFEEESTGPLIRVQGLATLVTALMYVQVLLGALYRHARTGLVFHIIGAFVVMIAIIVLSRRILRSPGVKPMLRKPAFLLAIHIILQIILGFGSLGLLFAKGDSTGLVLMRVLITTFHLVVGAFMLVLSLILTLWSYRISATTPDTDAFQGKK
ncbi:MAG: COX15/CtaA family protein [Chlamydiota bacterium]|nr:COX15/CtaA family protein [Chlamydiota bacterium]